MYKEVIKGNIMSNHIIMTENICVNDPPEKTSPFSLLV